MARIESDPHSTGDEMKIAHYAILKLQPYKNRSEHVNYGIVVFMPEGGIQVQIASPLGLRKVRALFPLADLHALRDQEDSLPEIVGNAPIKEAVEVLNAICVLRDQDLGTLGKFNYANSDDFRNHVNLALRSQVELPTSPRKARELRSRLFTDVRAKFKDLGILAKLKGELPDHQVVEYYSPDAGTDLQIEFALQNGMLRLAQTIDLRAGTVAARHSAFSKAYAIDFASKVLDKSALATYVIVAGTETEAARKIMGALGKTTDKVLSWEDKSDMESFFREWADASGHPLPELPTFN